MKTVEYTDKYEPVGSSAIKAFYWAKPGTLYVEFPRGAIAGYANFGREAWDDLSNILSKGGSAGRLYNQHVQGKFPGTSGDVELVPLGSVMHSTEEHESNAPEREFEITVEVCQVIKVSAPNLDDALDKIRAGAKEMGATNLNIKEARIVFN